MGIGKICFTGGSIVGHLNANRVSRLELQSVDITGKVDCADLDRLEINASSIAGHTTLTRVGGAALQSNDLLDGFSASASDFVALRGGSVSGNVTYQGLGKCEIVDSGITGNVALTDCKTAIHTGGTAAKTTARNIGQLLTADLTGRVVTNNCVVIDSSSLGIIATECNIVKRGAGTIAISNCMLTSVGSACSVTGTGLALGDRANVTGVSHHVMRDLADDLLIHSVNSVRITAGIDVTETAGSNITEDAGSNITGTAGSNITEDAGSDITETAGGNSTVEAAGTVTINGSTINLNT